MSQQRSRSVDPLMIGAIATPIVALLVLAVDVYLVTTKPDGAAALLKSQFPWMLVIVPLILVVGLLLGSGSPPVVPLLVILIAIAEERFQQPLLPQGGINLRLDELLAPSITLGFLIREWRDREWREESLLRDVARIPGLIPLGLFLVANLVPTALIMHDHARGASLFAILLGGATCYVGVTLLVAHVGSVREVVVPLVVIGVLEAVFGLGALALSVWQGQPVGFGVQVDPVTHIVEPYGTMYEANFFGQYLAAVVLIVIAFLVDRIAHGRIWSRTTIALIAAGAIATAGLLASETRAAWLGLAVGVIVIMVLWPLRGVETGQSGSRQQRRIKRWLPAVAVAAILVVSTSAAVVLGGSNTAVGQRFASLFDFSTGSGLGRLRVLQLILQDLANPILGMGDGSFNHSLPPFPGQPPEAPWIYSMFLAVFHDSGIIGLAFWMAFLLALYAGLVRVVRGAFPHSVQALALGMTAVLTCLLISGQATTGMYLIFFWAFLGLAGAVPQLAARAQPALASIATAPDAISRQLQRILAPAALGLQYVLERALAPATWEPARERASGADGGRYEVAAAAATPRAAQAGVLSASRGHKAGAGKDRSVARRQLDAAVGYAIPCLVGAAALALNFYRLDGFDIWYDEAVSYGYSSQPLSIMAHAFANGSFTITLPNMALHYFFLHYWIGILDFFGVSLSAEALRAPSAVFAASSVVIVYLLGRRVFSRLVGVVGATLYLCSYLQLYAAQQVRAYGLLMLLLSAAWYALFSAIEARDGRWRNLWWIAYTMLMVLAISDHLWSVLVLAGQVFAVGALLLLPGASQGHVRRNARQLALSFGVLVVFVVPLYAYALSTGGGSYVPVPPVHLSDLAGFFIFEAGGGRFEPAGFAALILLAIWASCATWLGYLPQLAGLLGTATAAVTQGAYRLLSWLRPGTLALCCWLVVPMLLAFAFTQHYLNLHLFYVRYLMAVSPALYLLVAAGAASLRWRMARYALAAILIGVGLAHAPSYYASQATYPDYHSPALWLEQHYESGDGLVCDQADTCALPMQYYLQLYHGPAHFDADSPGSWRWEGPSGIANDDTALSAYAAKHQNVCLLISVDTNDSRRVQQWFSEHGILQGGTTGGIRILCYRVLP